jgi:chlorobactene glucosyltransferase
MIIAVAIIVLANLAYAFRASYIAMEWPLRPAIAPAPGDGPLVSVLIPARNEERSLESGVEYLLAQNYPNLEIIIIDDDSQDATGAIAKRLESTHSSVRVVSGKPLPQGWVGKPWALVQGVRIARGQWLLFTDADMEHGPHAISSTLALATREKADAVSLMPGQLLVTAAEKILMPTILWTIGFATGRLSAVNDPKKPNALFSGGFILVERSAYDAIGGHESVRDKIAEDFELAHRFKEDGRFKTLLASGVGLTDVRMYHSFREIWNGFVKNFALGTRGNVAAAIAGAAFLALVSPITPLAVIVACALHAWIAAGVLVAAFALTIGSVASAMRRYGFTATGALWFPAALCVLVAIVAVSVTRHTGAGVTWRGRTYGPELT